MVGPIPSEKMAEYKATARARWQAEQRQRQVRWEHGWEAARQAGVLLKRNFDVKRVVVFGSLMNAERFTLRSDIDLAAWGLTSQNWLKASAAVRQLSDEVELNLVDTASCSPALLRAIECDGVEI